MPEASGHIRGLATVARRSWSLGERFALELAAPRRDEDAMIPTRTEAAKKTGCSADDRGHLVGRVRIADAYRPGALGIPGGSSPREALVPGPGLAGKPDRRELSTARIVRSVIDRGG